MTVNFQAGNDPPMGPEPAVDLLATVEGFWTESAEDLTRAIRQARRGKLDEAKLAVAAVKDLKAAFQLVMEERTRVEKLRKQAAGTVGTGTLDLSAARDEIGRRLARLRDAGGGG
jgi:hypothetical protein